jgi:hypothetical protein
MNEERRSVRQAQSTCYANGVTDVRLNVRFEVVEQLKFAAAQLARSELDLSVAMDLTPVFAFLVLGFKVFLAQLALELHAPLDAFMHQFLVRVENFARRENFLANIARDILKRTNFLHQRMYVVEVLAEIVARAESFVASISCALVVASIFVNRSDVSVHGSPE